jgi:CheY-like chemotaxis protein
MNINNAMKTSENKAVWIVDDDTDDHEMIRYLFNELNWSYPLELFETAEHLLEMLEKSETAPFIIISDVNLPKMDGFTLRKQMLQIPNNKFHSVPFIFWSTSFSEAQVRQAYKLMAHGFFRKEPNFELWRLSLTRIIEYWMSSVVPSREDKYDESML